MIRVKCPTCGRAMTAPDNAAGKRGKCPGCGEALQVPQATVLTTPEVVHDDFEVVGTNDFEVVGTNDFEIVPDDIVAMPKPKPKVQPEAISPKRRPTEAVPVVEVVEAIPDDRPRRKRRDDDYEDDDDYDDEADDDDRRRRRRRRRVGPSDGTPMGRGGYAVCYNCGADAASKVGFTWWGGIIGPAILSHVRCDNCGTTYNGRSGKSNNTAIAIYMGIGFAIGIGLVVVAALVNAL